MISINNLTVAYKNSVVLHNINLQIESEKITTIIGPNGSGKSTLIKCLSKQLDPQNGDIAVAGKPINLYSPKEYAKRVSYLKQHRDIPMISVERLVLHGRFPHMGFPRKYTDEDRILAEKAMKQTGVWHLRHKDLCNISGGECQKVYLAMILAQNTDILLLDEPSTYLDIRYQIDLLHLLWDLRNEGKTIITVLHDINSAVQISDYVCVLNKGEKVFFGSPTEMVESQIINNVFGVQLTTIPVDNKFIVSFEI